jgi:chitinase
LPNIHHGLYQTSTGAAPFAAADFLQTPGVETYLTLSTATSQGYQRYFDGQRIAA